MTELTLTININCPAEDVFGYVLDPAHSPDWIESFAYEETSEWPPRLGTVYRNRNQEGVWSEYRIEEFEQDRMFVLGEIGGSYHVEYRLIPLPDGTTQLEYHEWVDDGSLDEPFEIQTLENLKTILENPSPISAN